MAYFEKLTEEELNSNYEYKVIRKLLMSSFKWITNIIIDPSEINNFSVIFAKFIIDPELIKQEYGWDYGWIIYSATRRGPEVVDEFVSGKEFPNLTSIMDISSTENNGIMREIQKITNSVKKNPTIPSELKLPNSRGISVDLFLIDESFINKMKHESESISEK
jgi:hypothetical protein